MSSFENGNAYGYKLSWYLIMIKPLMSGQGDAKISIRHISFKTNERRLQIMASILKTLLFMSILLGYPQKNTGARYIIVNCAKFSEILSMVYSLSTLAPFTQR